MSGPGKTLIEVFDEEEKARMATMEVKWEQIEGDEWSGYIRTSPHLVLTANPYRWTVARVDPTGSKTGRVELAAGDVSSPHMRRKSPGADPLQLAKERAEKWVKLNPEKAGPV